MLPNPLGGKHLNLVDECDGELVGLKLLFRKAPAGDRARALGLDPPPYALVAVRVTGRAENRVLGEPRSCVRARVRGGEAAGSIFWPSENSVGESPPGRAAMRGLELEGHDFSSSPERATHLEELPTQDAF